MTSLSSVSVRPFCSARRRWPGSCAVVPPAIEDPAFAACLDSAARVLNGDFNCAVECADVDGDCPVRGEAILSLDRVEARVLEVLDDNVADDRLIVDDKDATHRTII